MIDLLENREIQLVINTPSGQTPCADEVKIRTTAGTPIMTILSGAKAAALKRTGYEVKSVQEYFQAFRNDAIVRDRLMMARKNLAPFCSRPRPLTLFAWRCGQ